MIETRNVCDIEGCDNTAAHTLDFLVFATQDEEGLHIEKRAGVDLCGNHELVYRSQLPKLLLKKPAKTKKQPA